MSPLGELALTFGSLHRPLKVIPERSDDVVLALGLLLEWDAPLLFVPVLPEGLVDVLPEDKEGVLPEDSLDEEDVVGDEERD